MNKQQNSLLILHFYNESGKRLVVGRRQKNISAAKRKTKGELVLKFASVTSAAAQLKFLASNKFNSLRKIFDINIMTFPQR